MGSLISQVQVNNGRMITEQDNLCYCILTLQYVKRHYVAGYLLVIIIITIRVIIVRRIVTVIIIISILLLLIIT